MKKSKQIKDQHLKREAQKYENPISEKEIYELLDVFTENNFSMDIPLTTLN